MSPSDPAPSDTDAELDALLARMRSAPPPSAVDQVALGLPARVTARLREERAVAPAYLGWALGLAPLTAACVALALAQVRELGSTALADPQTAGWLFALLG